jgi:hypothetical protein
MTTAVKTANTKVSNQALTRTFIVLKNKQQNFLSPKEALETSRKLSAIKRELEARDIDTKSLV